MIRQFGYKVSTFYSINLLRDTKNRESTFLVTDNHTNKKNISHKIGFMDVSFTSKSNFRTLLSAKKSALKMTKWWQWPVAAKKVKCPWKQHSVTTKWIRKCHYVKKHEPKESRTIPEQSPNHSRSIPDVS